MRVYLDIVIRTVKNVVMRDYQTHKWTIWKLNIDMIDAGIVIISVSEIFLWFSNKVEANS